MSAREAMRADDVAGRLSSIPGWSVAEGKLFREFRFKDFIGAFGFMAQVALVAQAMDHHPDWSNEYNTVRVRLSTHDAGGITERDFELAAAMNARVV